MGGVDSKQTRSDAARRRRPIVLSLTGEAIGEFAGYRGDRFAVRLHDDDLLWLSADCIYLEHPLYVELICHRGNLGRYVVDPP